MPLYASQAVSNSPLRQIFPGETYPLINSEILLTGQFSIAVCVTEKEGRELPGLSFEFKWLTDPGAFNFRIQGADTDENGAYFTEGTGTVVSPANVMPDGTFRARVELKPWVAKFARIFVQLQSANAVACLCNVTAQ
jgi:hypothetical protein